MSFWKKIVLGLAAAAAVFVVALAVAIFVPGGWKFSLILLGLPVAAGWLFWQVAGDYHSSSRRDDTPPPGARWDERTERWR
ncbi:hypothetical protein AB0B45_31800 [Nonomuraea sp. NPDC049152]|uniref:hypothetical protein n=1 Tax=Nonomuraea sp. NPDC049152 TaxID=3154350 RepID=UPI0033C7324E